MHKERSPVPQAPEKEREYEKERDKTEHSRERSYDREHRERHEPAKERDAGFCVTASFVDI